MTAFLNDPLPPKLVLLAAARGHARQMAANTMKRSARMSLS